MTKILGLDLGTNSIGWAVIDKENEKIIDCGVRIFPEGVVKETIGQGDKEVSKNAERREHRQARRQHFRKRLRKIQLLRLLVAHGMCPLLSEELLIWSKWDKKTKSSGKLFPSSKPFVDWLRLNPYVLRTKALSEPISLEEFGRILYHFIHRRGFLSSRKGKDDGAIFKGKEGMVGIDQTRQMVGEDTLGSKLFNYLPVDGTPFKRIMDQEGKDVRVRARYTLREMYVVEFEKIWQKQAPALGLLEKDVAIKRNILMKGNPTSSRNQSKIRSLQTKYGATNVVVTDSHVTIKATIPFKQFLAGQIETDSEGVRFRSNDSVLFWQRPLRSQKARLGKCTFESRKIFDKQSEKWVTSGSTTCPVSHPDFELFRAYQFINNIRYGYAQTPLNAAYREQVLQLMNQQAGNFDFSKVPKFLKLTNEQFNYDGKFAVPGNTTHNRLMSHFEPEVWKKERNQIWHYFHFYTDHELLAEKLMDKYGFPEEKARKLATVSLKEEYGSVSLKAIRNILPFLKDGYQYSTAVVLGGVKNSFGQRWDYFTDFHKDIVDKVVGVIRGERHQEYGLIGKIKLLLSDPQNQYGFTQDDPAFRKLYHHSQEIEKKTLNKRLSPVENLRNPIVQKGLQELRRLVNALLDKMEDTTEFGHGFRFDKIHVELSRDLRNSKTQRQEMSFKIRENEAANDEARARLQEYGLKASRDNIAKFKLYQEIQDKHGSVACPYTNQTISIADLLGNENRYQIEHIIPYSISLDDSFANKTLCESNFNRNKGEKTPYEYYQKNSDPKIWGAASWDEIEQRTFSILPYHKARRFVSRKQFLTDDFISRQLNDGRYISKKAAQLLTEICDDVRVMPGQLTSELRRLWGLNNIIQPVFPLGLDGIKIDEEDSVAHYVVLDSDEQPVIAIPKVNDRPANSKDQILIPGFVSETGVFNPNANLRHLKLSVQTEGLSKGKYWARINVSDPISLTKVLLEKPDSEPGEIVYRGRVEKGVFINDSISRKVTVNLADGQYWAKFQVNKTTLIEPGAERPPLTNKNQVLLFGLVNDQNLFTSYIYRCESNLNPGKYWAVLDLEFESAVFLQAVAVPSPDEKHLVFYGTVKDDGVFTADCDPQYQRNTTLAPGRYFATMELMSVQDLHPLENPVPPLKKGERCVEGNVWVNKHTGEIMFDPKKNRDDHRHHAVDAITIAFTELGYLQKISHYFAEYKERERGIGDRPYFDPPWESFHQDAVRAIENILVSYSPSTQVLSKISKVVEKNGKVHKSVGYSARGKLHREYFYGRHPRLGKFDKDGVSFEKDRQGNLVQYFHIRKSVSSIENNKHVAKIVDDGIRNLIRERLRNLGVNVEGGYKIPDHFFFDKEGAPLLLLPNKRGEPVPVRKVRLRESMSNAAQVKYDVNQWVNPYSNHHVVIYRDANDELKESVVSFWEVIERATQGLPVYQLPPDGTAMVTTMQVNDMFLLNLPQDIRENLPKFLKYPRTLSSYLFRVQKLSSMYYTFRHHLASTILNESQEARIVSWSAWERSLPIKVELDLIGRLNPKMRYA